MLATFIALYCAAFFDEQPPLKAPLTLLLLKQGDQDNITSDYRCSVRFPVCESVRFGRTRREFATRYHEIE